MDDITQGWSNLSLIDRKEDDVKLRKKRQIEEFALVARTFTPIWRTRNGFQIKNLVDHKLLFIFDNKSEMERVLQNEPWSYDKHLIVFQRYNRDTILDDYKLNEMALWVQVHNIPLGYMDGEIAEEICSNVGKVVQTKGIRESGGNGFIRVRVIVDISQPLCRGRVVTLENGTKSWVSFRYERLPNLCYCCGCLDHGDKDCEVWLRSDSNLDFRRKKYDSSIRAKLVYSSNKNVIHVPGFAESRKSRVEKPSLLNRDRPQATVTASETVPLHLIRWPLKRKAKISDLALK